MATTLPNLEFRGFVGIQKTSFGGCSLVYGYRSVTPWILRFCGHPKNFIRGSLAGVWVYLCKTYEFCDFVSDQQSLFGDLSQVYGYRSVTSPPLDFAVLWASKKLRSGGARWCMGTSLQDSEFRGFVSDQQTLFGDLSEVYGYLSVTPPEFRGFVGDQQTSFGGRSQV
jgi:hypothetical protein